MGGSLNLGKHTLTLFLLTLMSIAVIATIHGECKDWEYETKEGICCDKCPPGLKLAQQCSGPNNRSNCTRCEDGQFSDRLNFSPTCRSCTKCKASGHEYEVSPCKKDHNTICRCKDGFYQDRIDTATSQCLRCKKCGTDEIEIKSCTHENNTACACKNNHYRVKGKCEPCSHCTPECANHCAATSNITAPGRHHPDIINVIAGSVAVIFVVLALGIFITYMATKRFIKKKMLSHSSSPSVHQKESSKDFMVNFIEPTEETCLKAEAENSFGEQELTKLPDCIPMIPDLMYTVLDLVPVHQVKQLVRSLGVTDTEIEQAEMDHRFCREAHYQMLRTWAQRGSQAVGGGRGETVHRSLLEELLDNMRLIHLSRAAEELETKYAIQ